MDMNQVTLPVGDVEEAAAFYRRLGFTQIVDTAHYARFECPDGDGTFSLSLAGEEFRNGAIIYFEHRDLDAWVSELIERGVEFDEMPADKRYLWREASLRDPAGNRIKLYWAGEARRFPPWRVERRDRPDHRSRRS